MSRSDGIRKVEDRAERRVYPNDQPRVGSKEFERYVESIPVHVRRRPPAHAVSEPADE